MACRLLGDKQLLEQMLKSKYRVLGKEMEVHVERSGVNSKIIREVKFGP